MRKYIWDSLNYSEGNVGNTCKHFSLASYQLEWKRSDVHTSHLSIHSLTTFCTVLDTRNEKVVWKLEVRRNSTGSIELLSGERRYPFISLWFPKDALDMLELALGHKL